MQLFLCPELAWSPALRSRPSILPIPELCGLHHKFLITINLVQLAGWYLR